MVVAARAPTSFETRNGPRIERMRGPRGDRTIGSDQAGSAQLPAGWRNRRLVWVGAGAEGAAGAGGAGGHGVAGRGGSLGGLHFAGGNQRGGLVRAERLGGGVGALGGGVGALGAGVLADGVTDVPQVSQAASALWPWTFFFFRTHS